MKTKTKTKSKSKSKTKFLVIDSEGCYSNEVFNNLDEVAKYLEELVTEEDVDPCGLKECFEVYEILREVPFDAKETVVKVTFK